MPPPLLFQVTDEELSSQASTRDEIYSILPQQYEFRVLDGVCLVDPERKRLVAYSDIRYDAWWIRGHVRGKPLLPGILMLEMGGQAAALLAHQAGIRGFMGFGGVDSCKFRETVAPPARLHILCQADQLRPRRVVCGIQGVVANRLIFEATVTGLIIH